MANNQYVNKVKFGNETIMDISSDTIESDVLLAGYTAHDRSGAPITGSLSTFIQSGSSAAAGLVPAPSTTAGTTAFLCEDGSWKVPINTTYSIMTGASSSTAGTSGLVPAPAAGDENKFLAGDGTYKDGGMPMVVLSYGSSTWSDFINAYNNHVIVYCKASSNNNPASGAQTRMAFMAYVNADPPTNVEFQYYRSVSSHSATQMGDQVFIYKLDKTSGWSVTTREASIKQITGSGITVAWSSNKVTLTNDVTVSDSLTDTSTTAALSAAKGKALQDTIGNTTMGTTATTLTGAIAEHEGDISTLNNHVATIPDSTSVSTLDAVKTYLVNQFNNMSEKSIRTIHIVTTNGYTGGVFSVAIRYVGQMTRINADSITGCFMDADGNLITFGCRSLPSSPSWDFSALSAQVAVLNNQLDEFFKIPSETLTGNLDNALTPGWYNIDVSCTNQPPSVSSGKMIIWYAGTTNYVRQICFGGYDFKIYTRTRYYYNSQWLWTDWQEVTNSALLSPTGYTAPTNLHSNVTAIQGGYIKTGKLVVVNARFTLSDSISSGEIARFPTYTGSYSQVTVTNNKKLDMSIQQSGSLQCAETVSSGTLLVSCTYYAL